jgi:localization factor PodJL
MGAALWPLGTLMLHSDQNRWATTQDVHAFQEPAGSRRDSVRELAREIEETQRRQGETIAHIVERLRALDASYGAEAGPAPRASAGSAAEDVPSTNRDEPWDAASAEALMQSYEADAAIRAASRPLLSSPRAPHPGSSGQPDWLGHRFHDVTDRIKRTLSDLKPGSTMRLLEERLDQFQRHLSSVLDDVVRRSDLDALKLIETHINYLGDKLDELDRHVSRLDRIEADVQNVMDQVSDERIGKLLEYDSRFASDLDELARRAAEEMHSRLAHDDERARAEEKRHEELRALIESSILDQRKAEAEAASLMSGLSGRVTAQSDRYDELKELIDNAIQEQRQNEQTAFGVLDTLQQAMVRLLDRMDAIEQQQAQHVTTSAWPMAEEQSDLPPPVPAHDADAEGHRADAPRAFAEEPAHAGPPAMAGSYELGSVTELASPPPLEVPSAYATDLAAEASASGDDNGAMVDRLRRDFVADARRAKMKAAANRAEALASKSDTAAPRAMMEGLRTPLVEPAQPQASAGSGRLFGASPKLLAGVLAIIVAINGGILLVNRKAAAPAPAPVITIAPAGSASDPQSPDASVPGPRSALDLDDNSFAEFVPAEPKAPAAEAPAATHPVIPFADTDDVLDPPQVETLGADAPAAPPGGMTIAKPSGTVPDSVLADVYQQQVLASLSGKLGTAAAGQSPNALLPEQNGRIDAAFTPPDPEAESADKGSASSRALDLPPASVGPLSLRLAAANGDASAEFEVAARMAEGKGTQQSFAEALRWYQRSAAKGFAQAQYRLGTLYERGLGVTQDLGRARIWYGRAAEQGNVKSMHNLAVLAAGGDENGAPDYATALKWFTKAAEHGLADSQYNLGVLLENGLGVKADRVVAYKWYALAAKSGDMDATTRRDALKSALTAQELKAGDQEIAAFKPQPLIPLANDARAAGEDWKKRATNDTNG